MGKSVNEKQSAPLIHGASDLPSVTVDGYNLELRDGDGFLGDKANKSAFQEKLDDWRKRVRKGGDDPLGGALTQDLSKKQIDALLRGDDKQAAALIMANGAFDAFCVAVIGPNGNGAAARSISETTACAWSAELT